MCLTTEARNPLLLPHQPLVSLIPHRSNEFCSRALKQTEVSGDSQPIVGVVKSCCQHSVRGVCEPSSATAPAQASSSDKTESTRSLSQQQIPAAEDGSRAYPALSGFELREHPPTCTPRLLHTLAQLQSSPCCVSRSRLSRFWCWDTSGCPGSGWDGWSSPSTHGPAGWEQEQGPGAHAVGGHSGFVCCVRCGSLPPLGTRLLLSTGPLFPPCVLVKTRGELARSTRDTLAASAPVHAAMGAPLAVLPWHPPSRVAAAQAPIPLSLGQSPRSPHFFPHSPRREGLCCVRSTTDSERTQR